MLKTIITTCGISLLNNFDKFKKKLSDIDKMDDYLRTSNIIDKRKSAEIGSLLTLKEEKKFLHDELKVYLIASDTPKGLESAAYLEKFFNNIRTDYNVKIEKVCKIAEMKVDKSYMGGVNNLVKIIKDIIEEESKKWGCSEEKLFKKIQENIIFNVSGGYKGFIPVMTILALLYGIDQFYKFEQNKNIISIPKLPLHFHPVLQEAIYWELDFKYHDKDYSYRQNVKDDLKNYHFIDDEDEITELGKLFYSFMQKRQVVSDNVFGFFAEYKFYEYALQKFPKYKVVHSDNSLGTELDICVHLDNKNKIVIESKPLIDFLDANWFEENIHDQLKKQVAKVRDYLDKDGRYELWLYFILNDKGNKEAFIRRIKNSESLQNFKKICSNINYNLKVFPFEFAKPKKRKRNVNTFKGFARHKIKEKEIIFDLKRN